MHIIFSLLEQKKNNNDKASISVINNCELFVIIYSVEFSIEKKKHSNFHCYENILVFKAHFVFA